jgi:hypothetical protein
MQLQVCAAACRGSREGRRKRSGGDGEEGKCGWDDQWGPWRSSVLFSSPVLCFISIAGKPDNGRRHLSDFQTKCCSYLHDGSPQQSRNSPQQSTTDRNGPQQPRNSPRQFRNSPETVHNRPQQLATVPQEPATACNSPATAEPWS